jgi:hypothetical protein
MSASDHYTRPLTPCPGPEWDRWENGMYLQITKAGKPDRPRVFGKQDYYYFSMMEIFKR